MGATSGATAYPLGYTVSIHAPVMGATGGADRSLSM